MAPTLTDGQRAVLRAFHEFGRPMDDITLSVLVHHVADRPYSSSGIRSRRAELCRTIDNDGITNYASTQPLVESVGRKRLRSGRYAQVFALTAEGKRVAKALFKTTASV